MENKNALKTFFIIIGAIVSIGAIVAVLYTVFKKYFKVTFECDDCDCGCCGDDCFEEDEDYEPICCCECAEEEAEEAADEGEELAF
ncbi:MAG: hypothetical protein E7658_05580 [Ruminococcaceae bacterium]|nr:hypothetical protein [Oscillospiraceae bacterium]